MFRTLKTVLIAAVTALGVALWSQYGARVEGDDTTVSTTSVSSVTGKRPANPAAVEDEPATKPGKRNNPMPTFTPEREAAALTFVEAHHPELTPLLAHLKLSKPNEYQKAIRKLFSDSERLAHSREYQPRRYDLELQDWKLDSRIQLLIARLAMGRTPELERQLRNSLEKQLQVRRDLTALDRERLAERTAKLDEQLREFDERRPTLVDELFEKALDAAGQKQEKLKSDGNAKNGADKKGEGAKDGGEKNR